MFPPFGPPPGRDPSLSHPGRHRERCEPTDQDVARMRRQVAAVFGVPAWLIGLAPMPRHRRVLRWLRIVARRALVGW